MARSTISLRSSLITYLLHGSTGGAAGGRWRRTATPCADTSSGTLTQRVPSLRRGARISDFIQPYAAPGLRGRPPAWRFGRGAPGGIRSLDVSPNDRYGSDVLSGDWRAPKRGRPTPTPAEPDLVVEEVETGWVGAVVRVEKAGGMHVVHLEDRRGRTKAFPLGPGFLVDGAPVTLTPPQAAAATALADARRAASRTASGAVAVEGARARVASGSRIYVEGRHDAELVEKVWGDDLRVEGVVVELMDGVDDLAGIIAEFEPGPGRRLGVLVDHLVPGTKEARIVEQARALPGLSRHVKILGHPYVAVWQSVRAERLGWPRWPVIPRGTSWKHGICAELGWAHASQAHIPRAWKRILGTGRSYADLEPTLLASVEELIDFVTEPVA